MTVYCGVDFHARQQTVCYWLTVRSTSANWSTKGAVLQIIASAVTYRCLYIFYNDLITLLVTFVAGLLWGWIYHRYPNFWGIAFSHSVLGAVSIMVGLI